MKLVAQVLEEKDIGFGMVDAKKDAKVAKKLGKRGIIPALLDQIELLLNIYNLHVSIYIYIVGNLLTLLTEASYIQSFPHCHSQPRMATARSSGAVRFRHLARGYRCTQLEGAGNQTSNLLFSHQSTRSTS